MMKQGHINAFSYSPVPPNKKVHPTERPLELMQEIFSIFGAPGQRLLVPCCGSGVSLLAGHSLGLNPIGFDLSKQYKDSFLVKVHKTETGT